LRLAELSGEPQLLFVNEQSLLRSRFEGASVCLITARSDIVPDPAVVFGEIIKCNPASVVFAQFQAPPEARRLGIVDLCKDQSRQLFNRVARTDKIYRAIGFKNGVNGLIDLEAPGRDLVSAVTGKHRRSDCRSQGLHALRARPG
jgi:hypothetical protein